MMMMTGTLKLILYNFCNKQQNFNKSYYNEILAKGTSNVESNKNSHRIFEIDSNVMHTIYRVK